MSSQNSASGSDELKKADKLELDSLSQDVKQEIRHSGVYHLGFSRMQKCESLKNDIKQIDQLSPSCSKKFIPLKANNFYI